MAGFQLTASQIGMIRDTVRAVRSKPGGTGEAQQFTQPYQRPVTCVLDAAITAPTNGLTGATTATASVLSRNSSGNLVDAGYNITVVNRMEGISLVQYTLCVATWVDGEWRITSADCDALGSWP